MKASARLSPAIAAIVVLVLLVAAGWINYVDLQDAYGSGPPYYSQTTNMDKWTSPWPRLVAIDLAALCLIAVTLYFTKSRHGNRAE